jgi:hypothetical protein
MEDRPIPGISLTATPSGTGCLECLQGDGQVGGCIFAAAPSAATSAAATHRPHSTPVPTCAPRVTLS